MLQKCNKYSAQNPYHTCNSTITEFKKSTCKENINGTGTNSIVWQIVAYQLLSCLCLFIFLLQTILPLNYLTPLLLHGMNAHIEKSTSLVIYP